MTILVTGITGFLGNQFIKYVETTDFYKNNNFVFLTGKMVPEYHCILHNNYSFTVEDFIREGITNIDVVIHIGSAVPKTGKEFSFEYSYKYSLNIQNTIHLMENIPGEIKRFIYISTVSVYEQCDVITEKTRYQTDEPYGMSKLFCEKYLLEMSKKKNFILQILRLGPLYGPGEETYSKIVSFFTKQALSKNAISIYSDGSELRSMLYVENCCECILQAAQMEHSIGAVNIVSSQHVSLKNLAETICRYVPEAIGIEYGNVNTGRSDLYCADKMKQYFQMDEIPIEDGIKRYIQYYRARYMEEK